MHHYGSDIDELAWRIVRYAMNRVREAPPLDHPATFEQLDAAVGQTITPKGLSGAVALDMFAQHLAPACISVDHPRYLSFVPGAPTEAAVLFDLVVGASSLYGGSWLEGSGAVFAENQALAWLANLAGLPDTAGGVFVPGGSVANLSALVAARHRARSRGVEGRLAVLCADSAHSSVDAAAEVMDVELVRARTGSDRRLGGAAVDEAVTNAGELSVFAVVATAGTTNLGVVDDLESIGAVTASRDLWFHVDGAYGGAALAAPSARDLFAGIERCDSLVIDPHKWLFAPFDCAALLYRDPTEARSAHTQRAGYLDPITQRDEWNPSDYAVGLSRRARGLPFWFSLATHGTDAYSEAIETTLSVAAAARGLVAEAPHLEPIEHTMLSVVAFRRNGWSTTDYTAWSQGLLDDGTAFVVPTTVDGATALRLCIVNPLTTESDIGVVLDSLK